MFLIHPQLMPRAFGVMLKRLLSMEGVSPMSSLFGVYLKLGSEKLRSPESKLFPSVMPNESCT